MVEEEDYKEKYLRALADYDNLVKRTANDRMAFVKYANEGVILEVLEVLDDLEAAEGHIKDNGLTLIIKKLKDLLNKNGVTEIEIGEKFDPLTMECIETVDGEEEGMTVINKGYRLNEKVIRPTKVKVVNKIQNSNNK